MVGFLRKLLSQVQTKNAHRTSELDVVLGQPGVEVVDKGLIVGLARRHERAERVERVHRRVGLGVGLGHLGPEGRVDLGAHGVARGRQRVVLEQRGVVLRHLERSGVGQPGPRGEVEGGIAQRGVAVGDERRDGEVGQRLVVEDRDGVECALDAFWVWWLYVWSRERGKGE